MKRIILILCFIFLCTFVTSCNMMLETEKRGNDAITNVSTEDVEMNLIIENARKTINTFIQEMNDPNTNGTDFSVKYPFDTDPQSRIEKEHIWLGQIEYEDNKYYGIVYNDPFYIENVKYGDRVEFDINLISDWKYLEDGFLVGGESIKYFYDTMSEDEKLEFEVQAGFKIH